MQKRRGRPLKYDPDKALDNAMQAFWVKGLSATSLDELATAMDMNRPSIYNAFGDKESLYKKALTRFTSNIIDNINDVLFNEADLKKALNQFYDGALGVYLASPEQLSCFITCTAPVEATTNEAVKDFLFSAIKEIDSSIEKRLKQAQKQGWQPKESIEHLAKMLHGVLHSIAIRARSGESPEVLKEFAYSSVNLIVGCE